MTETGKPGCKDARIYHVLIFAVAALALAYQFLFPGFYNKAIEDALYTPHYIIQFKEAFGQGILYPRWMPDCFYGYGSPVFVFYSPALYLLSASLNFAGLGLAMSLTTLKLLGLYLGGVFVFYLLRERHGDRAALIAAMFYVLLPTRIFDFYFINSPAGRFATAWMPLVLLCIRRLVEGPFRQINLVFVALSYALLIFSHIATAYMLTPFMVAYGLFGTESGDYKRSSLRLALGIGAGICLSGALFAPVLFESRNLHLELITTLDSYSDCRKYPIGFSEPVVPALRHLWVILRNSILIEAGLTLLFLYLLTRHKGFRFDREAKLFAWALGASVFMMSAMSGFVWKYLPGISILNFPSRYVAIYLLFLSPLLGIAVDAFIDWKGRPKAYTLALCALLLCLAVYDALLIARSGPPVTEAQAVAMRGQVEMIEYLPKWVANASDLKLNKDDPLLSSDDKYSASISRWGCIDRAFVVDSPRGARLRVKTFYFPGWRAWMDGKEVELRAQEKTGAILINVPPGRHGVTLKFTNTWPRTLGAVISIITLVVLVAPFTRPQGRAPGA